MRRRRFAADDGWDEQHRTARCGLAGIGWLVGDGETEEASEAEGVGAAAIAEL